MKKEKDKKVAKDHDKTQNLKEGKNAENSIAKFVDFFKGEKK